MEIYQNCVYLPPSRPFRFFFDDDDDEFLSLLFHRINILFTIPLMKKFLLARLAALRLLFRLVLILKGFFFSSFSLLIFNLQVGNLNHIQWFGV